jgi:hypothetical protein
MRSKNHRSRRPEVKRAKAATPAQIDRMRDRYVEMIAMARKFDLYPSAMIDKAHSLLTRHWGNSDWASRAAILKTVDWLLKVAMIHPAPAAREVRSAPTAPMAAARPAMVRRSRPSASGR